MNNDYGLDEDILYCVKKNITTLFHVFDREIYYQENGELRETGRRVANNYDVDVRNICFSNDGGCAGCKMSSPWLDVKDDVLIDGLPAVLKTSYVRCYMNSDVIFLKNKANFINNGG